MNRLGVSISGLFSLALLMYIPTFMEEEPSVAPSQDSDALSPSYRAKNITTTLYDQEGRVNHVVFAKEMEHYDQLGFVLFQEPNYTLYSQTTLAPWQVTASEGTVYNNELIQLENNVIIANQTSDDFVQTITTAFLEINLTSKAMTSDQPVKIIGEQFVINSNGFNANLHTQQYELIDHVQTIYSPSN